MTHEMRQKIVEIGERERRERLEAWKKEREAAEVKANVSKAELETLD